MRIIVSAAVSLSLAACSGVPASKHLAEPVRTESGLVSGTETEVRAFRGISYAAAPIGKNRWRPPHPASSWSDVKDGATFGADCMQPAEYPELRGAGMSEDCLSVNVWSPAKQSSERLPVLVWIHGGGYTYGSGSHPSYDGEALARRGVVVVTLNYRLGLFGFMAHPQLTAESQHKSSGNYGVLEQIAALQWIPEVRHFGAVFGDFRRASLFRSRTYSYCVIRAVLFFLCRSRGTAPCVRSAGSSAAGAAS